MNMSLVIQSQLLATKFYVPMTSGPLISRPRLGALLQKSLKYPLTLVSAPAGFGKTMLLSAWVQSVEAGNPVVAWVSLDEEDNDPHLFWTYVLSALDQQQPQRFTPLLRYFQLEPLSSLKYVLTALSNLVLDSQEHFVLILDDYHVITEQQVHTTLTYLIERLPPQLHIILSTRTDPPLPLSHLRAHQRVQEMRTSQLRCTVQETRNFFGKVMGIQLPDEVIQQVTARTEGWLVGLQLLAHSLQGRINPVNLLEEASGDQRYILDYLTEEVLKRQSQDVQLFLLSTSILERLTASLCDTILQQDHSQEMLQRLEQANLFVVSLDSKREWYRYHGLFAETLRSQLHCMHSELVPILHYRASLWYAKHDWTTQAILHALRAKEWLWVADLIERTPSLLSFTWGASGEQELVLLREWLKQLPAEVMGSRPRLCLVCVQLLWTVAPYPILQAWLTAAESTLTVSLMAQTHQDASHPLLNPQEREQQENLLGEVLALRAYLQSFEGHGEAALPLCQQALALLSADNYFPRALIGWTQLIAYFCSSANDAQAAIQGGLQAISYAQASGKDSIMFPALSATARYMIKAGQLRQALRLTQQAIQIGTKQRGLAFPEVGWNMLLQAEILREWNELDAAHTLIEEAIDLCKQSKTLASIVHLYLGHAVLLRICLSCGELEVARSAFQQLERLATGMNQLCYLHYWSQFTTIDQVRLWLACGELDRATRWAEELDLRERHGTPFARECEEVACARIFLAKKQPRLALQRLEPILQRAIAGNRWGNVIELRLLQALAYQMYQNETLALDTLSEAVRLAEPEGYVRSFLDEGVPMEVLLSQLRKRDSQEESTLSPYLDMLLATFQQENKAQKHPPERRRQKALRDESITRARKRQYRPIPTSNKANF